MALVLYIALPLLCVLSIPAKPGRGAFALQLIYGLALYETILFIIGMTLGLSRHLSSQTYQAANWSVAIILAVQAWRNHLRPRLRPSASWFRTRRGTAALLLTVLMGLTFVVQVGFDAFLGTRHVDGLWYHIPRIIFWAQQHSFDAWPTLMWEQIGLPVGADVILGQKILLGIGWRGIGYITGLLTLGAIACVYIATLDLRLSRWQALMTALLFGSFPAIGLRIWAVNSDIAAAFPVLASYVVLHRVRNVKSGLAIFLILNGIALACKPTVAPLALILGSIAIWQCRHRITELRSFALPCMAGLLAAIIVISSYWPVYRTFSDFQGGENARTNRVSSVSGFSYSVIMSTGQWLLEPLGYVPQTNHDEVKKVAKAVYSAIGAKLGSRPESWWRPAPSPEQDRTGLAAIIMLPALLIGLPRRSILPASLLFLLGFVSVAGALRYMPTSGRFTVVLLAGYAVLWGRTRLFLKGRRRWILTGLVALNIAALLFESVLYCRNYFVQSQPGGVYYYLDNNERHIIASSLASRPLLVISGDMDALLTGPDIDFPLQYLMCPPDGDWDHEIRAAASMSNWLAVVHNGENEVYVEAEWKRPGFRKCTDSALTTQVLNKELSDTGWKLYKHNPRVDLWRTADTPMQ